MTLRPLEPGPSRLPEPEELGQLRSRYAGKCSIALNDETHAWEAVWHPTPTSTCLSYAPDLATLAIKLNQEGWATT